MTTVIGSSRLIAFASFREFPLEASLGPGVRPRTGWRRAQLDARLGVCELTQAAWFSADST